MNIGCVSEYLDTPEQHEEYEKIQCSNILPKEMCPICNRKVMPYSSKSAYMLKLLKMSEEELFEKYKKDFKDISDFWKFIDS
jgi:hypothetical protein